MSKKIIEFLRKKDFEFIKELGQGACGKTVLLYDNIINEHFVCKKYSPLYAHHKEQLFNNFIQEIKLLHLINHKNIVRVFNYYIYPDHKTGYILMEQVNGADIESYIDKHPENINDIFSQAIEGFSYLENINILHRDIRPLNLMVTDDGVLKIIDFGFGKQVYEKEDFDKSITLNWWCEPPAEFKNDVYNFTTEVYFVGKLFEIFIREKKIEHFKYKSALHSMCSIDPNSRLKSFHDIWKGIQSDKFTEIEFNDHELESYRSFSSDLFGIASKIERNTKYFEDPERIQSKIEELYKKVMLEESVPNNSFILGCFLNGSYYFNKGYYFSVSVLQSFVELLKSCSTEKKNIILSNLQSKLDSVTRYDEKVEFDDDIPF